MKFAALLSVAALLATSIATPADARGRYRHHDRDDVDAGDVIAGAIVVGGIAALLSAGNKQEKRARQDAAVGTCAEAADYRGHGDIAEVTSVSKRKGYYTVEGLLDDGGRPGNAFTCTVRGGSLYSFRVAGGA
jgi:hypothetical protein